MYDISLTFDLQGNNLIHGVRFSVHTFSCGNEPYRTDVLLLWGWNDSKGSVVNVSSMKFRDAQNKPESVFVSDFHRWSMLQMSIRDYEYQIIKQDSAYVSDGSIQAHNSTPVPVDGSGGYPHSS